MSKLSTFFANWGKNPKKVAKIKVAEIIAAARTFEGLPDAIEKLRKINTEEAKNALATIGCQSEEHAVEIMEILRDMGGDDVESHIAKIGKEQHTAEAIEILKNIGSEAAINQIISFMRYDYLHHEYGSEIIEALESKISNGRAISLFKDIVLDGFQGEKHGAVALKAFERMGISWEDSDQKRKEEACKLIKAIQEIGVKYESHALQAVETLENRAIRNKNDYHDEYDAIVEIGKAHEKHAHACIESLIKERLGNGSPALRIAWIGVAHESQALAVVDAFLASKEQGGRRLEYEIGLVGEAHEKHAGTIIDHLKAIGTDEAMRAISGIGKKQPKYADVVMEYLKQIGDDSAVDIIRGWGWSRDLTESVIGLNALLDIHQAQQLNPETVKASSNLLAESIKKMAVFLANPKTLEVNLQKEGITEENKNTLRAVFARVDQLNPAAEQARLTDVFDRTAEFVDARTKAQVTFDKFQQLPEKQVVESLSV